MVTSTRTAFAVLALFFLSAAYFLSGAWLSSVGVMDGALQSPNLLVRETAEFEIKGLRIGSAIFAAVFGILWLSWYRIEASQSYRRFTGAGRHFPSAYERLIATLMNPSLRIMLIVFVLALNYVALGERFLPMNVLAEINLEDGAIETVQALLLLVAAVLAARAAIVGRGAGALRGIHVFLALLFVVMVGEEISWGQRMFGFATPEAVGDLNVQDEFNLHNMFGYLSDHLFIAGVLLWGSLVPVLNAVSKPFNQLFRLVGLPIPSWGLATAMVVTSILFQEQILYQVVSPMPMLRAPELRELLTDLCFVLLMIESNRGIRRRRSAEMLAAA